MAIERLPRSIQPAGIGNEQIKQPQKKADADFKGVLTQEIKELQFSKHAVERIGGKPDEVLGKRLGDLEQAIAQARNKGGKETLVLMDNMAFVVSVTNNTVITAVDGERMQDNVFTNIDSAVVVKEEKGPDLWMRKPRIVD